MKEILQVFSKSRSFPSDLVQRARIVLSALQEILNQSMATQVGLHYNHAVAWRNRFLQTLLALREIEAAAPKKLLIRRRTGNKHSAFHRTV